MTADLNPRYTFDTLVVGTNNRLAVAAARSVAENPGTAHNPLFVYSETGLGKTHLLMAVGQAAREFSPGFTVEYFTLDDFVEAYHTAVSSGQVAEFRSQFGTADMILLDDVQFLARRQETQAELLRFATQLQESGTQMVLTSDCAPSEIADLDERLISRLAGGLVVDIGAPDFETRLAILNRRVEERGVGLAPNVLKVVAECEVENVRELLGVLNRLIAFQAVSEHPLAADTARALLEGGRVEEPAGPGEVGPEGGSDDVHHEFDMFLSEVTATVAEQVDLWQQRVKQAIENWTAKGYRTTRLEALLEHGMSVDSEVVLQEFAQVVQRLRALQQEIAECDPEMAGHPVFRDPERIEEAEALVRRAQEDFEPPPGPSEAFSIEDFLSGESTRVAIESAKAIIVQPGSQYNPLVLVGPSGVGKTHLLHAIGRALRAQFEGGWVACVSAQMFMDELVRAIEDDRVGAWRARYRRSSAFLLDNVDLIGARDRIQEEIFHLFNILFEAGRQLVFTSCVAPQEIHGLDDRLVSRLEGGLVASLDTPDRDLRREILRRQMGKRVGEVNDDLADYLADQPADSVRSVLGLGQRVVTAAEAQGVAPSVELAKHVLDTAAARVSRPSTRVSASGVVVSPSGGIESSEKMVWRWPQPRELIIEELV